jgi:uncharacterized lipoprotein
MRRAPIIVIILLLAACGSGEDSKVTETRMDDIDSLEGTISDEMVNTDELNEQPMVEAAPAPGSKPKTKDLGEAKGEEKAAPTPKLDADPSVAKGE